MKCSVWIIFANDTRIIWGLHMKTSQLTIQPCSRHISPIRRFARWFLLASSFSFWVIWNNQCMNMSSINVYIYMLLAKKYLHRFMVCGSSILPEPHFFGLKALLWSRYKDDEIWEYVVVVLFLFAILSYFNMNIDMWCSILNIPALRCSVPHWTST